MFAVCFVFRSFWIWELKNSGKTWLPFWGAHRIYVYVYKCMYMFICLFIYIKYVWFSKYVGVFVSNGLVQQPSRIVVFFFLFSVGWWKTSDSEIRWIMKNKNWVVCRFLLEMKSEVSINPMDFVGWSHPCLGWWDDISTLQAHPHEEID